VAELNAKRRRRLPDSKFAGPDRTYPIPDKEHAANAKARATQQVKAGKLTKREASTIKRKADRVLKAEN
jgi:hypothetical protein